MAKVLHDNAGNTGRRTRPPEVTICFAEQEISSLFSELLEAWGIRTQVLDCISDYDGSTRIITEPLYFPEIEEDCRSRCLLVGNQSSLEDLNVLTLSRPLTEAKIVRALDSFLGEGPTH